MVLFGALWDDEMVDSFNLDRHVSKRWGRLATLLIEVKYWLRACDDIGYFTTSLDERGIGLVDWGRGRALPQGDAD